jgi:hypothetical protein
MLADWSGTSSIPDIRGFRHGQSGHHQGQARLHRGHRLLLRRQEELATMTDKLVKKKYDPVARKHVEFKESKIK